MKKTLVSSILIFAALVTLIVSIAFTLPSFARNANPTTRHCQLLVAGTSNQPCFQSHIRTVALDFTGAWSQRVWVAARWTFKYICDGASPVDEFDVLDQYNIHNGTAWEVYARHIPLQCDGAWHSAAFVFRYAHVIQIGVSRPVNAYISMEVQ